MAKYLEICHFSLIKEIRKNSSEYGYEQSLLEKHNTRIRKKPL
ncbi:hypothetical protein [Mycoplasmopsis synoviae]